MNQSPYSFLALGDSYTIGESLDASENFPHQTVALLNQEDDLQFEAPKIIATTGWTTDELQAAIDAEKFENAQYDFVSLLIGVNNQYRSRPLEEYSEQFEMLLLQAINFSGKRHDRVLVLSIPDWGVTPFAREKGANQDQVQEEIDNFNNANKSIAIRHNVHYIDITFSTRFHGSQDEYLAKDGLHYSALEYKIWADRLANLIKEQLRDER